MKHTIHIQFRTAAILLSLEICPSADHEIGALDNLSAMNLSLAFDVQIYLDVLLRLVQMQSTRPVCFESCQ